MTWWAWLWIAALGVVTAAGMWDDWNDRRPVWYVAAGGLSGAVCVVCVVAYFVVPVAEILGLWMLTLALFSAVWIAIELTADYRSLRHESQSADRDQHRAASLGVGLAAALFAPAIALGIITGLR